MSSKQIIKVLKRNGWVLVSITGSHYNFKHKDNPYIITVPHPRKDLKIGTLNEIKKKSGLEF